LFLHKTPKPLVIKQESTKYDVAASELSKPLFSIINAVSFSIKEERPCHLLFTIYDLLFMKYDLESAFISVHLRLISISSWFFVPHSTESILSEVERAQGMPSW